MNTKSLSMILGAILVGAFFLAWFSYMGMGASGLDMVTAKGGDWQRYLILLIPLSGLLLFLGAMNNGNYILGRGLLTWLPLLTLIYILIVSPVIKGVAFGDVFKALGKGYGIGLCITLGTSIVLAFYNPKG